MEPRPQIQRPKPLPVKKKSHPTHLYVIRLIATTLLALFVFVFLAEKTWGMFEQSQVILRDRQRAELKLRDLEYKTDAMDKKVKALRTKEGREAALRAEFNVGRPGEKVLILVDEPLSQFPKNEPTAETVEGSWEWFANKGE